MAVELFLADLLAEDVVTPLLQGQCVWQKHDLKGTLMLSLRQILIPSDYFVHRHRKQKVDVVRCVVNGLLDQSQAL